MSTKTPVRNLQTTRLRLTAAGAALEGNPTPAQLRMARRKAVGAVEALDAYVEDLMATESARNKNLARQLAKGRKDARGRKRPPQTMPGYHKGRPSPNRGKRYKATPPSVNEVLRMLAMAPSLRKSYVEDCPSCHTGWRQPHKQECINPYSERLKAAIYLMWRGGLRVGCELLRLYETDLHPEEGYIFIERGKGGKTRDVVVDDWVWPLIAPWVELRQHYPAGPLFCVIEGDTAGVRPMQVGSLRKQLHQLAAMANVRHRVAPHQLRHANALEQLLEGINPLFISRNLGHSSLQVTDTYFQGLPQSRVVSELRSRPVPQVSMFDVLNREAQSRPAATSSPDLMGALSR